MQNSTLTARDLARAELGLPPIDVEQPRPISEIERAMMSKRLRRSIRHVEAQGYTAMVQHGTVTYRRTTATD